MKIVSRLNNLNNDLTVLTRGALIIAIFSVLSRLVGVLRDRLLASSFGAGSILDSYYAAFKIPDFIFNTFVLGALASVLIPIFIQYREQEGLTRSFEFSNKVLNLLIIILTVCTLFGIIFATGLVSLITPGFSTEALSQTVVMTRIMLLAVVIFGISNVLGSVLQAQQRLTAYAIAPVLYNIGIIFGIYVLVPSLGSQGLAWGVVLGSLLHLGVQIPAVWRLGFRWQPLFGFMDNGLKQFLYLLGPRTLGLAASQVNQVITLSFVSNLPVGSIAAFSLALNLHSFPINVFGVSLAVAVFPLLSQALTTNNHFDFVRYFSENIRRVLFYVLPLSVLFLVLRAQLVRVILGSGAFDWGDTIMTAQVLGFLALAIVSDSILPIVARSFYALKDTRTPFVAALISIGVNISLLILLKSNGLAGIGIAYVCSSAINLTILLFFLGRKLGNLGSDFIIQGAWRMSLASVVAASLAWGVLQLLAPHVNMNTFWGILTQGLGAGLAGVMGYIIVAVAFNLAEIKLVRGWLKQLVKLVQFRLN